MRLIDVDRLLKEFPIRINHYDKENGNFKYVLGIEAVMDYVKEMPTVEAIPVEWLRMWFSKKASLIGVTLIGEIESDWELENEQNKENTSQTD